MAAGRGNLRNGWFKMISWRKKWNEARISLRLTFALTVVMTGALLIFGAHMAFSVPPYDGGTGDGWGTGSSDTLQPSGLSLGGATIGTTIASASNQTFNVGQAATAISAITITEGATPAVTAANDIRIRIPGGFPMSWDATDLTAVISGSASAKVSTTVSYAGNNKILVLDVTSNFAANDAITVSGLQFTNFTALSDGGDNLELDINNDGGADALANKQIWISDQYGRGTGDGWDFNTSAAVSLEPPTKLVITTPARTITASTGSAPSAVVTVEAQTSGSVKAGTFYGTVTLASDSGTMKFDTSSTGAFNGSITTLDLSAGAGNFYFVDTTKGSPLITVSYTGLISGTQQQTVNVHVGGSVQLAFSTQPGGPVAAGANFSPQPVVDIQDQYGNRTGDAAEITLSVLGGTGGTLNAAPNPLTSTSSRAAFSGVNYTKVETIQLRASGLGFTVDSNPVTIDQPAAASKVVLTPPASITAGVCSAAFILTSQDTYGNTSNVASNSIFDVTTSNTATGAFYSNSGCSIALPSNQAAITSGTSSAQFYYKDTSSTDPTITATHTAGGALGASSPVVTSNPDIAVKVDLTGPVSAAAGDVTATAFTLTSQDTYSNTSNVDAAAGATFNLTEDGAAGTQTFYSDAGGTTAITQVTITQNTSAITFYYKDTLTSAARTVTAAFASGDADLTGKSDTHILAVNPAATAKLIFSTGTPPQTGGLAVVAGVTSGQVTVEAYDQYDNLAVGDTSTVFLSSDSPTVLTPMYFYANSTAANNDNAGASGEPTGVGAVTSVKIGTSGDTPVAGKASFYFKDTSLGTWTITATTDAGHTTDTDFNGTGSNLSTKTNTAISGSGPTATVNLLYSWACGDSITVTHTAGDGITPSSGYAGSITYDTALFNFGGSTGNKCMITRNLGATQQATSVGDNSAASAGWYWQFDKKQGYVDGPTPAWGTYGTDGSWLSTKDPCALLLNPITGGTWHIPTNQQWTDIDGTGAGTGTAWTTWSGPFGALATDGTTQLKLHAAGYLSNGSGVLYDRGSNGYDWSSTQGSSTDGSYLIFASSASGVFNNNKAFGYSVRCLKD